MNAFKRWNELASGQKKFVLLVAIILPPILLTAMLTLVLIGGQLPSILSDWNVNIIDLYFIQFCATSISIMIFLAIYKIRKLQGK